MSINSINIKYLGYSVWLQNAELKIYRNVYQLQVE